ncbi:PAS/PAC sensor hybrid histidine kinase [Moraxella macacae 0408225]|uniref:histidine kinase n=1 Tax=Moraxella macacae 0408225 TaxID=1230338 RepID=L2F8V2_9GAMM|nr:response regulator [Moraxella macacae]ELA09467.1 PAS/PAC sensor hybrid histidine kinase [Moraxella macacae 0408225]
MRNSISVLHHPTGRQGLLALVGIMLSLILTGYGLLWLYATDRQRTASELLLSDITLDLNQKIDTQERNFIGGKFISPKMIASHYLVIFEPTGRAIILNNNSNLSSFNLPTWSVNASQNQTLRRNNALEAWRPLHNGYRLYVYIEFVPIWQTFVNPLYVLPWLLFLLFLALCAVQLQKRYANWFQLIDYAQNFSNHSQSGYQPLQLPQNSAPEILQLNQIINRISFKNHQYYDEIYELMHRQTHLIDKSPVSLFLLDRKGRLIYFNEKFANTFATPFDKNVVYMLYDFITGMDKQTQQQLIKSSEHATFLTLSVTNLQRDLYFDLHLNPFYNHLGQLQGFSGGLEEVTNYHEKLEKAWIGDRQTAEKLAGFDKLWAVLGHELRTPLSGMMGMIELLVEDKDSFNEEQQETIATLQQSSQTMLGLLNDMLDVAKIDAGKLQANITSVDLLQLLNQTAELMIGNAKRNNISLYIYTDPNAPRYIETDDGRMRQVLLNLMSNAIKFTKQGYVALLVDKLTSSHPVIQQKKSGMQDLAKDWLCITVKDTGMGISPKDQQKLFSYFNQANDSISRQFGGTGLGLAISNNFSQLLGGFINLESEVGKGSEFQVFLPLYNHSLKPVFELQVNQLPILLIIISPFDITRRSTEILNFVDVKNIIFTEINEHMVNKINALNLKDLVPMLIIDEVAYVGNEALFEQISLFQTGVKVIISMDSERTIKREIMRHFDGLIQKPPTLANAFAKILSLYEQNMSLSDIVCLSAELAFQKFLQKYENTNFEQNKPNNSHDNSNTHNNGFSKQINPVLDDVALMLPNQLVNQALTAMPAIGSFDKQRTVLVAEDNLINQKIAKKHLETLGYEVIIANEGEEAVALLSQNREKIALVLMDCQMPIMDGLTATRQIRANQDSIPIIALTANDSDESRKLCSDAGMDGFLTKPINKQKLTKLLSRYMI